MSAPACTGMALTAPGAWSAAKAAPVRTTLANGLRAAMAEDHTVPVVFVSWTSQAGFELDPPGFEGIASLTPVLLREGTARRTAEQITQELDDLGAVLSVHADREHALFSLALLSSDLAAGVDLALDMACAPTFPQAAFARLRQRRLAEIVQRRRDPRALASDELGRALFGATTYCPPLGTTDSVRRIDAADVAAFHQAHYGALSSCVGIAGSFDRDAALVLVGSFERPARGRAASPPLRCDPALEPPGGIRLVDVPHARQAEIRVGHAGIPRDCEDLPALDVLNTILGGGPGSRLARSLRHHLGLAYHVRSRFAARRLTGSFTVETSVATEAAAAAVAAIRREVERLGDELVPADELQHAKRRLVGARLRFFQDLISTGLRIGPAALEDDADDPERTAQAIAALEPADLRELARRYLHPERLIAVIAGAIAVLGPQFSSARAHLSAAVPLESTS